METECLIQSVLSIKLPSLTSCDQDKFLELLHGIFPEAVEIKEHQDFNLQQGINQAADQRGLMLSERQQQKMHQLHVALQQRMGVIIVGTPRSGKSTLWSILKDAYSLLKRCALASYTIRSCICREPILHVMPPKAMDRSDFLGWIDVHTREWHDGLLTAAAREIQQADNTQPHWVICDGDIDPEWIESLNSVLDDNRCDACDIRAPKGVVSGC